MLKILTLLFVFLLSISALAQVVIEEKVEIGDSRSENNLKKGSSIIYKDDIPSGFIMPKSGLLQVYYNFIDHFDWELPDYSTLNSYYFKGDSTSVDSLSYRFTSYIIDTRTFYNYCPPAGWEDRYVWMYLSPDPYLYDLGNVAEGDSVQMIYHSDMLGVEGDIPISFASEVWVDSELVGWDVTFAYLDGCIGEYVNTLQMFVGIENDEQTILLGETKYFQSKRKVSTGELKIEEIEPDENGFPHQQTGTVNGWEWITTDVWGNNPVSVDTCDSCGQRVGVYWEKKYPTNQFEDIIMGKKKYRIVKMDSLDAGLIRIIGRYWTPDSIYTVNLKAHYNNDSTYIKITVKKPTRLGDTFSHTTDVIGMNLNIDSLIIEYCGESGISPYLTKGQMFQEAKKVGGEFKPSYRYEPFYEVFYIRKAGKTNQYFNSNLPFVVSSSGMGSGDPIPTTHTNVYPIPYPTSPIKIGQFFYNNFNEYKRNLSDGTIKIIGSDNMTKRWNQLYDYYIDTLDYQPNLAKQKAIDSLKIEIRDGLLDTLFLEYAQTRKVASYGFLQVLGITPPDKGYYSKTDPSKPPEKINEQDILMPMYVWLIKKNLKTSMNNEEPINNWPRGYEAELTRSLFYYNTDVDYGKSVYNNSKDFKPEN